MYDDYTWEDGSIDDYGETVELPAVTADPNDVTPDPNAGNDGETDDNTGDNSDPFAGIDFTNLDENNVSTWSDQAVINTLNQYNAGWVKTGDGLYTNKNTGQKYDSNTGVLTDPQKSANQTSTGSQTQSRGGASGNSGGASSSGKSSGGASSGATDAISKMAQTLGALLSNAAKVATAATAPKTSTDVTKQVTAGTTPNYNNLIIAGVAGLIGIIAIKKLTK